MYREPRKGRVLKFAKKWIDDGKPDLLLNPGSDYPARDTKETSDVTTT